MKTEETKLEAQQEQLDIPVVISWRLIFSLLIFSNKTLEYSKFVKNGLGFILWLDVLGIVLFARFMYLFIACL